MWKKALLLFVGGMLFLGTAGSAMGMGLAEGGVSAPLEGGETSSAGGSAHAIFGGRRGYIHPYLSLGEYFTDNLFNTDNPESDTYTVITPGIWLALPGSRQPLLDVTTLDSAPGGLEVGRFPTATYRRFQGYLLYRANIERHNRFSQEDNVYQRGEGLINFNFRGGLSIEVIDIFQKDHDPYGTGTSVKLDKFRSNLVTPMIRYQIGPKTNIRIDYSNYSLKFSDNRNDFRNRNDNSASIYLFRKIHPKTSLFVEYDYIDVNYDTDILNDNTEQHYLGGLQWNITERTRGQLKLGASKKKFSGNGGTTTDFLAEIRLDYLISPKTSVYIIGTRKPIETDIQGTTDILSYRLKIGYLQRLTAKIGAHINLHYYRDRYQGNLTVGTQTGERKDDYYGAGLGFGYALKRWLKLGLDYEYDQRDSNFHSYDYRTNTVFFSLTAAI
jgi:hypothetical protein